MKRRDFIRKDAVRVGGVAAATAKEDLTRRTPQHWETARRRYIELNNTAK